MSRHHPTPWPRPTWTGRTLGGVMTAATELLTCGHVDIVHRGDDYLQATVESRTRAGHLYRVTCDAGGDWRCDCVGWKYARTCSHIQAIRTVTAEPSLRRIRPGPLNAGGHHATPIATNTTTNQRIGRR